MQIAIIPALLARDAADLHKKWGVISTLKTPWVQIDVCDGTFVHGKTFHDVDAYTKLKLPKFEVDLMVNNPAEAALEWILAGADRIIFHIEAFRRAQGKPRDPHVVIDLCRLYHKEVVIAIAPGTRISSITPYLKSIHGVQFKGVKPGKSGQQFMPRVLKNIAALHVRAPQLPIEVDGGVHVGTIRAIVEAGATRLGVSSALLSAPDVRTAYHALVTAAKSKS
jgi:ribulose-phosphate 3-epimerase